MLGSDIIQELWHLLTSGSCWHGWHVEWFALTAQNVCVRVTNMNQIRCRYHLHTAISRLLKSDGCFRTIFPQTSLSNATKHQLSSQLRTLVSVQGKSLNESRSCHHASCTHDDSLWWDAERFIDDCGHALQQAQLQKSIAQHGDNLSENLTSVLQFLRGQRKYSELSLHLFMMSVRIRIFVSIFCLGSVLGSLPRRFVESLQCLMWFEKAIQGCPIVLTQHFKTASVAARKKFETGTIPKYCTRYNA
jgi:hypothetical protein